MRLSSEWQAARRDGAPSGGRVDDAAADEAADEASDEASDEALEAALEAACAAGAARWPGLALSPEAFVRHLARLLGPTGVAARASLAAAHVADLYLACACLQGVADAAIASFEAAFFPSLASALAGAVSVTPEELDEVRQRLRVKLLVGDPARGRAPLVGAYSGRGPLAAWVRVAAVREALTLARDAGIGARASRRAAVEGALDAGPADPELAVIKGRYRRDFEEAFAGALRGIADRERALLRLHTVGGLSLEKIGAIYKVDRSTVSRWLAAARHALLDGTERGLRDRLGLAPAEVESMARLLTSQLEIDLPELLRTSGG